MKIKTFYKLFYKHRFDKASVLRKIYLAFIFPLKYIYNYFYLEKKKNLDLIAIKDKKLFLKDLNFLFEYFNSDKGEYCYNQYSHPSKIDKKKITSTWVFEIL